MSRPAASLSLDLDNEWSYLKIHGNPDWQRLPSFLDTVVPRALEMLAARGLRITFFVVGQDAALEKNAEALGTIAAAGHEVGNHSFGHDSWLHLYSREELAAEIERAEEALGDVTGAKPVGFRGPGYSHSAELVRALIGRGYLYDSSSLPAFTGPLARAYYFMTARLSSEQKKQRATLFGTWREGLRPLAPYRWSDGTGRLLEIPLTTVPVIRVPFHFSYLLYLAEFSEGLARAYLRVALRLCRARGVQPSLLLHSLDFVDGREAPALKFFPAMGISAGRKVELLSRMIDIVLERYYPLPLREYAATIPAAGRRTVSLPPETGPESQ